MSAVRLLVGTRKGAFVLTSDGKRADWKAEWSALRGLGNLSPQGARPLIRTESTRVAVNELVWPNDSAPDDGGRLGKAVGKDFIYDGTPGTSSMV